MTMRDDSISFRGCAARFSRLSLDGSTATGATNAYVLGLGLISVLGTPNYVAGVEINDRDACGNIANPIKERDTPQRWDVTMILDPIAPDLEELLVGAPLITGTYQAPRTAAVTTTSGQPTVTSSAANFSVYDVGATIAGTGITGGTTILSVQSATAATLSANATATGSASLTITGAAASIGNEALALGVAPSDNGVSVDLFANSYTGASQSGKLPYWRLCFPRVKFQRGGDIGVANAKDQSTFVGLAFENSGFGDGPFHDWRLAPGAAAPSGISLSKVWGRYRTDVRPTAGIGYVAVP